MSETIITVVISNKGHQKQLVRHNGVDCIIVQNAYLPVRQVGKFWYLVASLEMDNDQRRNTK